MDIWYEPIVEVLMEHTYYSQGRTPDFTFMPTEETSNVMRGLGLVMKSTPTGFRIFCKLDTRVSVPGTLYSAIRMETPFRLIFQIANKNSLFANFTDLPTNQASNQFYYFSNRVQVSGANVNNLLLGETSSTGGKVGTGDLLQAAGDAVSWSFNVPALQTNTDLIWQDATGATVLTKNFASTTQNKVLANFDQLYLLPDGRYTITTNPNTPAGNRTFYKHSAIAARPPFGVLEIFSHPTNNDYRFRQEENVNVAGQIESLTRLTAKTYRIHFERRILPWQFFVVRRDASSPPDPANLQIVYGANQSPYPNGITFSDQPVLGDPNKRLFTSSGPVPFFETPKKGIELQNKPLTPAMQALENLPNPTVSAVRKDDLGNLYAESIIYI